MGVTAFLIATLGGGPAPARASASFDCEIEPSLRLKIAAHVSGTLMEVLVDRGTPVAKGQLLARLDTEIEMAALALDEARAATDAIIESKRARVDFLTRKRARFAELVSQNAGTPAALDEASTDLQLAIGDLREAEKNKELARLEAERQRAIVRQRSVASPIDGIVVERNLFVGEYAYEQAPIMTVAQIDPLKVEVYLPTALYTPTLLGTRVDIEPEAPLGGHDQGTVELIDSVFDARSGTFGMRLNLPNPGNKIPAGLRCRATFPDLPHP